MTHDAFRKGMINCHVASLSRTEELLTKETIWLLKALWKARQKRGNDDFALFLAEFGFTQKEGEPTLVGILGLESIEDWRILLEIK